MFRTISAFAAIAVSSLGAAQTISVYDAVYRLEADARSGSSFDSQSAFNNNVGPIQNFFHQIDAFASEQSSSVHSWASVGWNCTPTDLSVELVACWDSLDNGAGNSGHMLSRLFLGLDLDTPNIITIGAVFDQPNSWAEIDVWNGSNWVLLVNRNQIQNYAGVWIPGSYRFRGQRLYDPVGNSTGCLPWAFNLHAEAVPEPASVLTLGAGLAVLIRRRRARTA